MQLLISLAPLLLLAGLFDRGNAAGADKGRFLLLSDLHLDPFYRKGGLSKTYCHQMPRKHRYYSENSRRVGGLYGARKCDCPAKLLDETLLAAAKNGPYDFVLMTGSFSRHLKDKSIARNPKEVLDVTEAVLKQMKDTFKVPVYATISNTDGMRSKLQCFTGNTGNRDRLGRIFGMTKSKPFMKGGYYVSNIRKDPSNPRSPIKMGIISLNVMWLYKENKRVNGCSKDEPGDVQLRWLEYVLKQYKEREVPVYIIGHAVPNPIAFFPDCYHRYASIVAKYASIVQGQFFGHHDRDEFMIMNPAATFKPDPHFKRATEESIINGSEYVEPEKNYPLPLLDPHVPEVFPAANLAPAIMPKYNPSFRVFDYDRVSGALIDYVQYFADLDYANKHHRLEYMVEYVASMAYPKCYAKARGINGLFYNLLQKDLQQKRSEYIDTFMTLYTVQHRKKDYRLVSWGSRK